MEKLFLNFGTLNNNEKKKLMNFFTNVALLNGPKSAMAWIPFRFDSSWHKADSHKSSQLHTKRFSILAYCKDSTWLGSNDACNLLPSILVNSSISQQNFNDRFSRQAGKSQVNGIWSTQPDFALDNHNKLNLSCQLKLECCNHFEVKLNF